jgi:hypothetical protein
MQHIAKTASKQLPFLASSRIIALGSGDARVEETGEALCKLVGLHSFRQDL